VPKLRLPWGEELSIEQDIEQFHLDIMRMTAEYYTDINGDSTLIVVTSEDFQLAEDDDTIVVKSAKVRFIEVWPEEEDTEEVEQVWRDFMLDDDSPPKEEP